MNDDLLETPPEEPYEPTIEEINASQYVGSDREYEEFGDLDDLDDSNFDLEFGNEEFDELYDEFDENGEDDEEDQASLGRILALGPGDEVEMRTAVMLKNEMIALLCIKSASEGAAICRVDPREPIPAVQLYDDPDAATNWYARSLESSKRNGWRIAYYGLPLRG
jgi:hypothetical protein